VPAEGVVNETLLLLVFIAEIPLRRLSMGITAEIKERAHELGYDLCGVIQPDSLKKYSMYLDKRIERFPNSRHLYEKLYDLASPEKKAEWAKSTIVCVRRYNKYKVPPVIDNYFGKVYLFDGRLPYAEEYKNVVLFEEYLKGLGVESFKDSVTARWAAVNAGLGQFGKNNFLYTRYGSWVWVDTWTVNMELEYDNPAAQIQACPENCTKCIDACPTRALSEPFAMDRGICIAHLSFFSTELPSEPLRDQMGTWLYGCDACQDACPKNKNKWDEEREFPGLDSTGDLLSLERIAEMDEKTYLERVQPRFWYIGKDSIWLWKCNAIRAMANSRDERYHRYIRQAREERDEKVKDMASWACKKLGI
jgi:epoxyqueuosine reductase